MFIIYSTLHNIPFIQLPFLPGKSSVGNLLCQSILHDNNKENASDFFSRRTLKIETNRSFSRKNTFKIHEETKWGLLKLVVIKTWWYLKKKNNQIHTARKPITKILQTFKFCPPKVVLKAKDNNAIEDSVTVQLRISEFNESHSSVPSLSCVCHPLSCLDSWFLSLHDLLSRNLFL